jgi:hypothetical protein
VDRIQQAHRDLHLAVEDPTRYWFLRIWK